MFVLRSAAIQGNVQSTGTLQRCPEHDIRIHDVIRIDCSRPEGTVKGKSRFLPAALAAIFAASVALPVMAADLVIAMPNWPSGQATANILKVGIAKKFGLDAEVKELGTLNAFVGFETGTVDIQPEVWRPNFEDVVRKYVTDKGVGQLTERSVPAWQGLCATPEAAKTIKSAADLSNPDKTKILDTDGDGKGEMWIGAATWLSTGIERARAAGYGYDKTLTLFEAEEEVAMAAVDAAVATDRPMVFTATRRITCSSCTRSRGSKNRRTMPPSGRSCRRATRSGSRSPAPRRPGRRRISRSPMPPPSARNTLTWRSSWRRWISRRRK